MSEQVALDGFLQAEGERLRDVGQERAAQSDPDGYDDVERQILELCEELGTISSDDLSIVLRTNVVGAAFGRLAHAGRIEIVGYRRSTRPRSHARRIAVWRRT